MNKRPFIAVSLVLLVAFPLMAEDTLNIDDGIPGIPGNAVSVPVMIDDGSGLDSFDLMITYDTTLFDLSGADVSLGTLTSGWSLTHNIDDTTGVAIIGGHNGAVPLPENTGFGSLFDMSFQIDENAPLGISPLVFDGSFSVISGTFGQEITPTLDSGSINVVPEPSSLMLMLIAIGAAPALLRRRRCRLANA